jgi:cytoskeletal protein RodZ
VIRGQLHALPTAQSSLNPNTATWTASSTTTSPTASQATAVSSAVSSAELDGLAPNESAPFHELVGFTNSRTHTWGGSGYITSTSSATTTMTWQSTSSRALQTTECESDAVCWFEYLGTERILEGRYGCFHGSPLLFLAVGVLGGM